VDGRIRDGNEISAAVSKGERDARRHSYPFAASFDSIALFERSHPLNHEFVSRRGVDAGVRHTKDRGGRSSCSRRRSNSQKRMTKGACSMLETRKLSILLALAVNGLVGGVGCVAETDEPTEDDALLASEAIDDTENTATTSQPISGALVGGFLSRFASRHGGAFGNNQNHHNHPPRRRHLVARSVRRLICGRLRRRWRRNKLLRHLQCGCIRCVRRQDRFERCNQLWASAISSRNCHDERRFFAIERGGGGKLELRD